MADNVSVYAVGDVGMSRADAETAFVQAKPVLHEPDIMFGQLEACFSRKGTPPLTAQGAHASSPNFVPAVQGAGFDIMSFASNHCMHFGAEGLLDTIEISKKIGIPLVGVGKDINEARKPVVMERKGVRIAFLAYCSILPPGYWATEDRPGCAPLRANTFYEPAVANQPGAPADVRTYPLKEDQEAMVEDIRKARQIADVVAMSVHWGLPFAYATIDDYQRELGHAAIDAGADIVIGHHAHILRGIEIYKGKAIFYSIGNFAQDASLTKTWPEIPPKWRKIEKIYNYKIDPEWGATYPFPIDARNTMIATFEASKKGVQKVGFRPTFINHQNQAEVLKAKDPRFNGVIDYVTRVSREQKMDTQFSVEGDQVVITI